MARSTFLSLWIGFSLVVLACSSSSSPSSSSDGSGTSPGDDGGNAGADGGAATGPRPLCGGGKSGTFAPDLGEPCGAGSNQTYCATPSTTCSSGACLWDGVMSSAYCTAACDPSNANSCPAGFACAAQGCNDVGTPANVCTKKAAAPDNKTCSPYPPQANNGAGFSFFAMPDGTQFLIGPSGANLVILSAPAGSSTWTQTYSTPFANGVQIAGRLVDGTAAYLAADVLIRLEGSTGAIDFQAPQGELVRGVFRGADGAIHAATDTGQATNFYTRGTDGKWTASGSSKRLLVVTGFSTHGFAATCDDALCVGETGPDAAPVALPPGESFGKYAQGGLLATGASTTDFVAMMLSSAVYRRSGSAWIEDGLPTSAPPSGGSFSFAGFVTAVDGTLYAVQQFAINDAGGIRMQLFRLDGACWTALGTNPYTSELPFSAIPGGRFEYASGEGVCSFGF